MERFSAKIILIMLAMFETVKLSESVKFNRNRTGVKFAPYIDGEGMDLPISILSTTTENVKTMLEIVSTKFSRVLVDSVDAHNVVYQENFTYYHETLARGRTAEMAARINRERNHLALTVMIGISLTWSNRQRSETEVRVALDALQIAESIYPGTVEGLYLSNFDVSKLEWAEDTFEWLLYLRNHTAGFGVRIGTEQACDENRLRGINQSDPISLQIQSIRKQIISSSDFIICFSSPGQQLVKAGATVAFNLLQSYTLKARKLIQSMNRKIEFMWSTLWTKSDMEDTQKDYENLGIYWGKVDNYATKYDISVWLDGAFAHTGLQQHFPWWRLLDFHHRNNISAYEENYTGTRVILPKTETGASSNATTSTNSSKATMHSYTAEPVGSQGDFWMYGGVLIGIIAVLALSGLVYLIHRCRSSRWLVLRRQEMVGFRFKSLHEGTLAKNDHGSSVNLAVLQQNSDNDASA